MGYDDIAVIFGVHGYYSPVRQLTFAARIAYTTTSGSVPFHELGTFSFILGEQSGLGNETTHSKTFS